MVNKMVKEELKSLIIKAIKSSGFESTDFLVERPKEASHGEYSTSIALVLAKKFKKSPMEVANEIVAQIIQDLLIFIYRKKFLLRI